MGVVYQGLGGYEQTDLCAPMPLWSPGMMNNNDFTLTALYMYKLSLGYQIYEISNKIIVFTTKQ